jgi:hypothetical protein
LLSRVARRVARPAISSKQIRRDMLPHDSRACIPRRLAAGCETGVKKRGLQNRGLQNRGLQVFRPTGSNMAVNDLTAPLGQGRTTPQGLTKIPVAPIIAATLGLFLGAFVLWAVIVDDPAGGKPVAVAPADLRIPKKGPELIAVPQAAVPVGAPQVRFQVGSQAGSQAGLQGGVQGGLEGGLQAPLQGGLQGGLQAPLAEPLPAAPPKPRTVTVTIVDGKTGAKRDVVVGSPERPAGAAERMQFEEDGAEVTGSNAATKTTNRPSRPNPAGAPTLRSTR